MVNILFEYTDHARQRMRKRKVTEADIERTVLDATSFEYDEPRDRHTALRKMRNKAGKSVEHEVVFKRLTCNETGALLFRIITTAFNMKTHNLNGDSCLSVRPGRHEDKSIMIDKEKEHDKVTRLKRGRHRRPGYRR